MVRNGGQSISLTNAFLKPARPRGEDVDLVDDSIAKLESYYERMREPLGPGILAMSWADRDMAKHSLIARSAGLGDFFETVTAKAFEGNA